MNKYTYICPSCGAIIATTDETTTYVEMEAGKLLTFYIDTHLAIVECLVCGHGDSYTFL
jgi:ribosomal protein S27E